MYYVSLGYITPCFFVLLITLFLCLIYRNSCFSFSHHFELPLTCRHETIKSPQNYGTDFCSSAFFIENRTFSTKTPAITPPSFCKLGIAILAA